MQRGLGFDVYAAQSGFDWVIKWSSLLIIVPVVPWFSVDLKTRVYLYENVVCSR